MTEFQPEDTTPTPNWTPHGASPYQGMPDLQGQPYGQPYGQVAPTQAPPQGPGWGAPPPAWSPAPAKKRKAWPWVVGGIGALVVLGVATVVAFFFIGNAAVDGLNPNYDAPTVAEGDVATSGGTLVIADGAMVAFEAGQGWTDQSGAVLENVEIPGNAKLTYMGVWATVDPTVDPSTTLVMVSAGEESIPLVTATLKVEHQAYIASFLGAVPTTGVETHVSDPVSAVTASGLSGLHSDITVNSDGMNVVVSVYTFARGKSVAFLQVISYNGAVDAPSGQQVLDTLRIDK